MKALLTLMLFMPLFALSQQIKGKVLDQCGEGIPFAKVMIQSEEKNALTDLDGAFLISNVQSDSVLITVRAAGYAEFEEWTKIDFNAIEIRLVSELQHLDAVVITATLKEISKKESTVNVEVLSPKFFKKNPTPSIYDALQNVNGVRPQLNCNICNTGDIHINGLEGPYTMVLIDGMPIVSSLSTVYGLSGIPSALIEQVEIVKGPSSTLYGSEAIGGIINIITKKSSKAPTVYADVHTTSWLETNADIGFKLQFGDRNAEERKNNVLSTYIEKKPMLEVLTGINYFNYDWKRDLNNDGFTDLTLQDRISIFQKYKVNRKDNRVLSFAARYLHEDRWGGELDWTPQFRGGDSIYGESIYTSRWELIGKYQLPFKERIFLSGSLNQHAQNSFYGNTSYMANQLVGFGQLHWDKRIGKHDLIVGAAYRYINYDDDTPATEFILNNTVLNNEDVSSIYGVFVQDEIRFNRNQKLLLGMRYDYNSRHGSIYTPRIGYKATIKGDHIFRLNAGMGYRIVNIFTEDHAALTGAREVVIAEGINPEQSYNGNLNYNKNFHWNASILNVDFTAFYTWFDNRIVADYDTDPNEIRYENLDGYAVSRGISTNITYRWGRNFTAIVGATLMDIGLHENGIKEQQILTENFTGTWSVSYDIRSIGLSIDYTGNVYSPMRLPLLNDLDPRPEHSPWWSLQNIQWTFKGIRQWEIYGGVKNLLNWTPNIGTPFMIAGANDPFDANVSFDAEGNALQTPNNPYALTFDPAYVYAPNQGIRGFLGVRYTWK